MSIAERFTAALAAYRDARSDFGDPAEERIEAALAEVNRLAEAILSFPAGSTEALRLKARALAWEFEREEGGAVLDRFRLLAVRGLLTDLDRAGNQSSPG